MSVEMMKSGMEVLLDDAIDTLAGARVGLLTVPAAIDRNMVSLIDRLHQAPEIELAALFGPEHGVRGNAQAGEHVADAIDSETGLPVYSLYGSRRAPTPEMLYGLDVMVIDLFDVGCRYWTYPYAMAYTMTAAADAGIKVVVLDRPNPITGTRIEGNLPAQNIARKINGRPVRIPIRTGLTLGELARLFNRDLQIGADLTVIPCQGWERDMWYDETPFPFVLPSPNVPTLDSLTVYPGTCLVEGTHLSEGRGTTRPFELIGAPWIHAGRLAAELNERQLPGVRFRPAHFVPVFSKHKGELCAGVQVHITDREIMEPVAVGIHLLHALRAHSPAHIVWRKPYREGGVHPIDHLSGSSRVRLGLDAGEDPEQILADWKADVTEFESMIAQDILLY